MSPEDSSARPPGSVGADQSSRLHPSALRHVTQSIAARCWGGGRCRAAIAMTRALLPERTELISTIWVSEASVSSNDCKAELLGEGVSVPVENAGP